MNIRALVFDLAGVLLDFGGVESVHKLSDGRVGDEKFFRFWSQAKCAHDFHRGRCTPEEFAWQAVRELGLRVTSERFLAEFRTWLRGPYPGALELLEGLRPQYRVACLRNADALHVRQFDEELHLQDWFDECFYSNEIGFAKTRSQGLPTRQQRARHSADRDRVLRRQSRVRERRDSSRDAWTALRRVRVVADTAE